MFCRLLDEDILRKKISDECSFTKWIFEQIITSNGKLESGHQFQSFCSNCPFLLYSTSTLSCLFWCYLQFACILLKQVLSDQHNSTKLLLKKLSHAVHITTIVYEQCPQDSQNFLIEMMCLKPDILLLCGRIAISAIEGISDNIVACIFECIISFVGEIFEREVTQFLVLINKFILLPACTVTAMRSFVVNHLHSELEAVKQTDQQSISGVSKLRCACMPYAQSCIYIY